MKKIIIPLFSLLIVAVGSFILGAIFGYINYQKSDEYLNLQKKMESYREENIKLKGELKDAQYTIDKMGILPPGAKYVRPIESDPWISPTPIINP